MGTQAHISRRRDEGFTLIEALVVMAVLASLAAIAIPVFNGQQKKAVEASLKADLHNYALYESAYGSQHGVFGSRAQVDAWIEDVDLSLGNTLQVISGEGSDEGFCLRATDITTTMTWYYDSTRGGLMKDGSYCGTPTNPVATPPAGVDPTTDGSDQWDGCKGSGHGGPGNRYCPGSNGNGGVGGGNGGGNGNGNGG